jgi:transcriptional regulator with XRE-family HTH domain
MSTKMDDIIRRWMKDPAFRREYDALEEEFTLARELIRARAKADLTQAEVAKRMRTSQSAVARLEGGRMNASLDTLRRYARATGSTLRVSLDPVKTKKAARGRSRTAA